MGKLVRVLVVVCLILSIVALVLGMKLFGKRELLKGRTQKLEESIVQLGALIEAEAPEGASVRYPERDTSPITTDFLNDQQYTTFWASYSNSYEVADVPTMNIKQRMAELTTYYKRSADGKILKDARGLKVTTGNGTMQALLNEMVAKAEAQYNRLNDTRQQLVDTRTQLVEANQAANEAKALARQNLDRVAAAQDAVARMTSKLETAEKEAQEAKQSVRSLEDTLTEERRQLQFVEEQKIELEDTITQLKDELKQRVDQTPSPTPATAAAAATQDAVLLDPGVKGTVVAVNETWNFVIVSLSDDTLQQLLGDDQTAGGVQEFMIQRGQGEDATFVTKIRLQQIRRDKKLAIASILTDWQQMPVQEGDIVVK